VATLTLEQEKTKQSIRDLMAAEDPKNGVFHHEEIFRLQQEKLRLDVDIKFRTNKINRVKLGIDGMEVREPDNGFLF